MDLEVKGVNYFMDGNSKIEKDKMKDSFKALILIVIFTLINIFIPILNFIVFFIWPLPIIYLIVKYAYVNAFSVIIIAALINGILLSPLIGLITVLGVGLTGFIIGGCLQEDMTPDKTLTCSIVAVLVSQFLILLILDQYLDFNFIVNNIREFFDQVPELSHFEEMMEMQLVLIREIYPALIVIFSMITGTVYYYVSLYYLNKKEFQLDSFTPIRYWYFSRWIISLGLIITLFLRTNPIFLNINVILFFVCFIQGFAVGLYYIAENNKGNFLKILYVVAIFVLPFFPLILTLTGLSDMWFNFRKL